MIHDEKNSDMWSSSGYDSRWQLSSKETAGYGCAETRRDLVLRWAFSVVPRFLVCLPKPVIDIRQFRLSGVQQNRSKLETEGWDYILERAIARLVT